MPKVPTATGVGCKGLPTGPLDRRDSMADILARDLLLIRYRNPQGQTRFHQQPGIEIHLTDCGHGWFWIDGHLIEHGPREVIIFDATRPHQLSCDPTEPFRRSVVCFDDQQLGQLGMNVNVPMLRRDWLPNTPDTFWGHHLRLSQAAYLELDQLFLRMQQEQALARTGWQAAILSMLTQVMVLLHRRAENQQAVGVPDTHDLKQASWLVQQGCQHVQQHLADDLSLDAVSEKLSVSPEHLTRSFRLELGMPFHRYVLLCRVNQARQLLGQQSDLSITQVALAAGFGSSSQFSRAFRRLTGQSPTDYRQSHSEQV